jgi:hypothetical protein
MLTIIVWTNIIVIEIGFILGAALLLSKAGNEDDSDDPSRMSSTEVCSLHLPPHDMACLLNFRSKCFEDWGQFSSRLVSSGCASFAIFGKGWLQLLLSKIISSPAPPSPSSESNWPSLCSKRPQLVSQQWLGCLSIVLFKLVALLDSLRFGYSTQLIWSRLLRSRPTKIQSRGRVTRNINTVTGRSNL